MFFFSPKNDTRTFFYNSIVIPEPKATDGRKKIKMQPLSAILCLFMRFFAHFVRFMLIYAFFFERENEAFVHRCAQGPSLSKKLNCSKWIINNNNINRTWLPENKWHQKQFLNVEKISRFDFANPWGKWLQPRLHTFCTASSKRGRQNYFLLLGAMYFSDWLSRLVASSLKKW